MNRVTIAVDAMGGDNAPLATVRGAADALRALNDIDIRLYGDKPTLDALIASEKIPSDRMEVIHAEEVITMHDEPMLAVRRKRASSMVMGLMDVKNKLAHAFVSAGSTGAMFLGGMAYVRMLPGIERPALAPILPGLNGAFMLIDSGANADCQPRYLMQFGLMGSVYMNLIMGVNEPKVGLVNIGAEDEKGNKLVKEAFQMMRAQNAYRFMGNCEARDIQLGDHHVVVTDGFTGNVILKYAEGFASMLLSTLKCELMSSVRGKIGAVIAKPAFNALKKKLNTEEYGGAPLLGVDGVLVKSHGSSSAFAFSKAIGQARAMVLADVPARIREGLTRIENSQN